MSSFEEEKVGRGKRTSYSMIWFVDYIVIAGISVLIFYYYETELGLAAIYVGIALIIFALWNMVNDPLIGFLTDKPMRWSKKYGLRLPWIILGGIGTVLFYYLLFTVPNVDAKTDPMPVFWYMIIMTCLFDTFYSLLTTHAYGGFTNIFRTQADRKKGGTIGQWMGSLSRLVFLGIIVPFIIVSGDPSSYVTAALVTSIIMAIGLIIFIPGAHEDETVKARYFKIHEYLEEGKISYIKFLKITFKQKNFMIGLFAFTMFTIGYSLYYAGTIYFIEGVLRPNKYAPLPTFLGMNPYTGAALSFTLAFMISIFIWSRFIADKFGHANTYAFGLGLLGLSFLSSLWVTTVAEYVMWHLIAGAGTTGFFAVWMSIGADTNDEVTNACGRHQEAALTGLTNFFFRFSFVVVGLAIGITNTLSGYTPGAFKQTPSAQMGIRIYVALIPAIACFVGALVFVKFYDLKDEKRVKLMASLREKGL